VIGGTNLDGDKNRSFNENKTSNEVTLTLNINADGRFDKDELMTILRKTELLQELNKNLILSSSKEMGDNLRDPSIFRIGFFSDNSYEKYSI
jgi:hypothetical protein